MGSESYFLAARTFIIDVTEECWAFLSMALAAREPLTTLGGGGFLTSMIPLSKQLVYSSLLFDTDEILF